MPALAKDWAGHRILVTGVSRPGRIGAAITEHCAHANTAVVTRALSGYDRDRSYPEAADAATE
ncbi:hypothetical protein [Nocardia sp. NPDC051570]|uniref:hypothetical protein n=1 Tax=Nocardia sp. NPDC051570 TaxID=3364324 RepID=UPI003793CB1A